MNTFALVAAFFSKLDLQTQGTQPTLRWQRPFVDIPCHWQKLQDAHDLHISRCWKGTVAAHLEHNELISGCLGIKQLNNMHHSGSGMLGSRGLPFEEGSLLWVHLAPTPQHLSLMRPGSVRGSCLGF